MNTVTPLSISDRVVDETRSLTQHDYREDPLGLARALFYGAVICIPVWSVIVAAVVYWWA